jgi:hypothetical protein
MNKDPLREAAELLNSQAPEGEEVAYINKKEAEILKKLGGAGVPVNSSGVKSYFIDKIFGTDEEAPAYQKMDMGQSARDYVDAMADSSLQNKMLGLRQEYDPLYQELQLSLADRAMDPMASMAERSALRQQDFGNRMADRQASSDIGMINRYGSDFQDAYRSSDPLMQARVQQANQLAEQAFKDAQMTDLSPEMRRRATQSARETLAATGRSFDNAGIAAEAMSREDYLRDILRQNRQDFQNYNQNAANSNQATRVDPLRLLRGGDEYSQRGYGERAAMFGIPQESVTRINPDAGVNIGMMENANLNNYNAANYGARMEAKAGMMQGLSSMLPFAGSAIGGGLGLLGKGFGKVGGMMSGPGMSGKIGGGFSAIGGGLGTAGDTIGNVFGGSK